MRKNSLLAVILFSLFYAWPAKAICPVCTIAVGAGIGLSRYLGIDDAITGAWIGGLIISIALWTDNWLKGKNKNIAYQKILLIIVYYAVVILPLYWKNIIGHPFNKICGVDKILFGIIFGSLGFWLGSELHLYLKKRNGDKVYFPFQKVAFGLAPLIILSLVFYIISKC
jgi:hypothetical protein